jgi:hypothetical protein
MQRLAWFVRDESSLLRHAKKSFKSCNSADPSSRKVAGGNLLPGLCVMNHHCFGMIKNHSRPAILQIPAHEKLQVVVFSAELQIPQELFRCRNGTHKCASWGI